jgi:hypothetical protein
MELNNHPPSQNGFSWYRKKSNLELELRGNMSLSENVCGSENRVKN